MNNSSWQTILDVGCEGGCIILQGRKRSNNWSFKLSTNESSLSLFAAKEDLHGELKTISQTVSSWKKALKLLNTYPSWPTLYAVSTHPDFADRIMAAIINFSKNSENENRDRVNWSQWKNVLFGNVEKDYITEYVGSIYSLESLRDRLREFAKERDWDQYHTPKNLSMALIAEAAELVEHFQWVEGDKSHLLEDKTRTSVEEELADILIYLVRISDKLGIDLYQAVERKLEINEKKYPAELVRGSAKKYTEYSSNV